MWDNLISNLSDGMTVLCTILAFVIPYIIYKINQKLHAIGDPPWKKTGTDTREE
ncbi:hypothetical protein [Virgibacillus kimchii]